MPRPLKKSYYSRQKITHELLDQIAETFGEAYDDREYMGEHHPSLREMAEAFEITPIKMRKLLITAGVYSTETSRKIAKYLEDGLSVDEIQHIMQLSRASVHSYISYTKAVYKLPEKSTNAERTDLYRHRNHLVQLFQSKLAELDLLACIDCDDNMLANDIWELIVAF